MKIKRLKIYTLNSIKDNKTVGIIGEDKEKGLTYVAEPIGVICGVTPTTNRRQLF